MMKNNSTQKPVIGIVGGVGPYAGLDLARKVFDNTIAYRDQDHLPLALLSLPDEIGDRTAYLLGELSENPGRALADVILRLDRAGATVVGIPCNTAHAPEIFGFMQQILREQGSEVTVPHMIRETVQFILETFPKARKIGVLSTLGTYQTGIYPEYLEREKLKAVVPDAHIQQKVHDAIYSPKYGIKAYSNPVKKEAVRIIKDAANKLKSQGAEVVILGCTELPLAIREKSLAGCPVVDPTQVLARALIRESYPQKLKPLDEVL